MIIILYNSVTMYVIPLAYFFFFFLSFLDRATLLNHPITFHHLPSPLIFHFLTFPLTLILFCSYVYNLPLYVLNFNYPISSSHILPILCMCLYNGIQWGVSSLVFFIILKLYYVILVFSVHPRTLY